MHKNLEFLGAPLSFFSKFEVVDYFGIEALWKGLDRHFDDVDLVFTVFGPAYFLRKRTRHLFGFAQPNLIYPNNLYTKGLRLFSRIWLRARYGVQAFFFARADSLVVELEHVQRQLSAHPVLHSMPVAVVHSAVHSVFFNPSQWAPVSIPEAKGRIRLGVISRNYSHKNLGIFPRVKAVLLSTYGIDVELFVTFTSEEWDLCSDEFRASVTNVGGLSLSQCPSFYERMDGVLFPSLLECFSAVPIEAMAMRKPLFASKLPFILDVCGDFAEIFDPLDERDIARVIAEYFESDEAERVRRLDEAQLHAERFPGPMERALSYLSLIARTLQHNNFPVN